MFHALYPSMTVWAVAFWAARVDIMDVLDGQRWKMLIGTVATVSCVMVLDIYIPDSSQQASMKRVGGGVDAHMLIYRW